VLSATWCFERLLRMGCDGCDLRECAAGLREWEVDCAADADAHSTSTKDVTINHRTTGVIFIIRRSKLKM